MHHVRVRATMASSLRERKVLVLFEAGLRLDTRGNEDFEALVIRDLVPEIDRSYRTEANRGSRAIAGLSMGGGQAIKVGLGKRGAVRLGGCAQRRRGRIGARGGASAASGKPGGVQDASPVVVAWLWPARSRLRESQAGPRDTCCRRDPTPLVRDAGGA